MVSVSVDQQCMHKKFKVFEDLFKTTFKMMCLDLSKLFFGGNYIDVIKLRYH